VAISADYQPSPIVPPQNALGQAVERARCAAVQAEAEYHNLRAVLLLQQLEAERASMTKLQAQLDAAQGEIVKLKSKDPPS
jgi:protein-disulfide isomerase